jgi:hypothetical protein
MGEVKMKLIIIFLVALIACCYSQKNYTASDKQEIDARYFRIRCMHDSCYQLKDDKKRSQIQNVIDSLFKTGKINYHNIDTKIKTDGKYYGIRLFADGYSLRICDSLQAACEDTLPQIYHEGYPETPNPPCVIEGCFIRIILDSGLNLIWVSKP